MAESIDPIDIFLDIERKHDSAVKLAAVQGKPHNEYLFAPEFNKVVQAIKTLRRLIIATPAQIQQIIATGVPVPLGNIEINFIDFVNSSVAPLSLGTNGTSFITFTTAGIDFVYVFIGTPGQYGFNSTSLAATDVIFLYKSDEASPPTGSFNPGYQECFIKVVQNGSTQPFVDLVSFNGYSPDIFVTAFADGYFRLNVDSFAADNQIIYQWSNYAGANEMRTATAYQVDRNLFVRTKVSGVASNDVLTNGWMIRVIKLNQ
ncbi:hypothetical protein FNO01nite_30620 [Flavobacterium noncentrifugens]|uniref:Uncharacterized protein n=1 Tax=Flavobacterium noncentrifugens TaxID=1128970 RepID=A0A1G9BW42_9FLAO|nr:hypothetical protein [Flavobacterium noncentrifugens]GEP52390.1 hypothetical protein FNO01nite_30620 [Flavobacterium noncentrifugens]SDK43652.1 hypothetical protein SAMN04487935_3376 [Flavobacterium noncentrifugens]